jgi:hypothetical protein
MRLALVAILMAGCATKLPELPKQPDAPTRAENIKKVGAEIDTSDAKVAAAVTVVSENAGKPEVVKAESAVALSFLPKPPEAELALARQRAAKSDQKDYEAAEQFGRKLLSQIDSNWAKVEADQREAFRVSKLKDDRIAALTAEVERVKKDAATNIWTMTGAGLVVVGGLACAFASIRVGIPIILCGAFAGALPFLLDSPYFAVIAGLFLATLAGLGIWWFYDRVRDSINESDAKKD